MANISQELLFFKFTLLVRALSLAFGGEDQKRATSRAFFTGRLAPQGKITFGIGTAAIEQSAALGFLFDDLSDCALGAFYSDFFFKSFDALTLGII